MEKQKIFPVIVILVICILGLSSFIVYDKILDTDKNKVLNKEEEVIDTPQEFINRIMKTEEVLENKSEYTVNYKDFSYTSYKNEYNNISNIAIKYKDKQINKDLSKIISDLGLHTLNSYHFDKETGLFILTLLVAPVAATPITYIIAFDTNGNIKIDESVEYKIYVDEKQSTLFYTYQLGGGITCYDTSSEMKYQSAITYEYTNNNEILESFKLEKTTKDLPKCE